MDDVEHHLALVDLDGEVLEVAAVIVTAPHPQLCLIAHQLLLAGWLASSSGVKYFSSSSISINSSRSSRIGTWSSRVMLISGTTVSPSARHTSNVLRQSASIDG